MTKIVLPADGQVNGYIKLQRNTRRSGMTSYRSLPSTSLAAGQLMLSSNATFLRPAETEFEADGTSDFAVSSRVRLKWSSSSDGKSEAEGSGSLPSSMVFVAASSPSIAPTLTDATADASSSFGHPARRLSPFVRSVNADEVGWRLWSFCELLVGVSRLMAH